MTLSMMEAKYKALTEVTKELKRARTFLAELGRRNGTIMDITSLTGLYSDNQSTIAIAKNPVSHASAKHIDIRHHFIRETTQDKIICTIHPHIGDDCGQHDKSVGLRKASKMRCAHRYNAIIALMRIILKKIARRTFLLSLFMGTQDFIFIFWITDFRSIIKVIYFGNCDRCWITILDHKAA